MRKLLAFAAVALFGVAAMSDRYDFTPLWPEAGTEGYFDAETLSNERTTITTRTQHGRTDGWTGGVSQTVRVETGRVPTEGSRMPIATKDMFYDDGHKILSATLPPGMPILDPMVEFDNSRYKDLQPRQQAAGKRQVADWVAKEGLMLRQVLEEWCESEGWTLVWNTKREYPLRASAIFRGRFTDVSAALIRTFGRAIPPPHARYYTGNKVLVVTTLEERDGN
ncbi:MAG: toxin co-regulated pilus biosynthesis Q family protein [Alphaproteobacteria bacterium]|nr:toxin co-regulated pilus biosynthesis Q family protein [Alphaproteobacteria bacterium]